jgi:hypothetical protein
MRRYNVRVFFNDTIGVRVNVVASDKVDAVDRVINRHRLVKHANWKVCGNPILVTCNR